MKQNANVWLTWRPLYHPCLGPTPRTAASRPTSGTAVGSLKSGTRLFLQIFSTLLPDFNILIISYYWQFYNNFFFISRHVYSLYLFFLLIMVTQNTMCKCRYKKSNVIKLPMSFYTYASISELPSNMGIWYIMITNWPNNNTAMMPWK